MLTDGQIGTAFVQHIESLVDRVRRGHLGLLAGKVAAIGAAAAMLAMALPADGAIPADIYNLASCTHPAPMHVPDYYMSLRGVFRHTVTGAFVTAVHLPKPFKIGAITGAADDRTFVLAGHINGPYGVGIAKFFLAQLHPATRKVTLKALALPEVPTHDMLTGLALSPDGTRLATAVKVGQGPTTVLSVYTLPDGPVKQWRSPGTIGGGPYDSASLWWSCAGTLAITWLTGRPPGNDIRLLSTSTPGGSLIAQSHLVVRMEQANGFNFNSDGMLTNDGKRIVATLWRPVGGGTNEVEEEFAEFSARTGKLLRVLDHVQGPFAKVFQALEWTNSTGSVLVVAAQPPGGGKPVFGVLSGRTFRPLDWAQPANGTYVVFAF
jgi:hypothetical protein